ncbi:MAG: hypothetical protein UV15_C0014G0002 [Candidatus Uhrbacteria bacterium GW2011_GWA2_42_220]|nr:MAG: hypothetical protein UV15_C0014G0002 [Candidatus Uhrbacteria bacterium GW2011_GWA2_42_220]
MNKATLALRISERLNINKKDAEDMIASLQDIIIEALKRDEEVTIAGLYRKIHDLLLPLYQNALTFVSAFCSACE